MTAGSRTGWRTRVGDWFDERFDVRVPLEAFLKKPVPKHAIKWYFCLGGITFALFLIQGVTGILLSLYYKPTPEGAYESILFIMNNVRFGWLIRSIHSWAATLMVAFCVAHMLRVFITASYKNPRELNWVAGVVLLLLTLAFGFTGYLLGLHSGQRDPRHRPPDWGLAAWLATRWPRDHRPDPDSLLRNSHAGSSSLSLHFSGRSFHHYPSPGNLWSPVDLYLGGNKMDKETETGSPVESGGPRRYKHPEYREEDTIPFFPNYVILEVIVSYLVLALLIVLASVLPVGLEEKADPFNTPQHIKPEWYFLWIYQFIKVPPIVMGPGVLAGLAGIFVPAVGILLLFLLPFLDRKPERHPRKRRLAMAITALIVVVFVALSIWGWYS
jgi:ubiquinol-cytochrome c reductase cytochrome b subunit